MKLGTAGNRSMRRGYANVQPFPDSASIHSTNPRTIETATSPKHFLIDSVGTCSSSHLDPLSARPLTAQKSYIKVSDKLFHAFLPIQVTYCVLVDLALPKKLNGRFCGCGVGARLS